MQGVTTWKKHLTDIQCKIAIDEIGVAFLMPVNASIQDLVLQFPRADVTLLARQSQQEFSIGQCSIEGQGQEILVCGKNKFVTSTDPSFFRSETSIV